MNDTTAQGDALRAELEWMRQRWRKHDDGIQAVLQNVRGEEVIAWLDRVDAALASSPAPLGGADPTMPEVPTRAMLRAAKKADMDHDTLDGWLECGNGFNLLRMWPAMRAAATPPQRPEGESHE